jgi:sulfur-carrier protein
MKVHLFAILKDYFDHELWIRDPVVTIEQLKEKLVLQNEEAEELLNNCRFAVNDQFIDNNYILQPNDIVSILPPSSGG